MAAAVRLFLDVKSQRRLSTRGWCETISAVVSVEVFTLSLSVGGSREEDGPAEDGWGSDERSEGKNKQRVEVRSQKNKLSSSTSHGKQEIKDHRE